MRYEVITDTLNHLSKTKKIDVRECSSVLVEIISGHCYINDILPLRATAPTASEYAVRSRLFEAPQQGKLASEIYITPYSSTLKVYSLLITKIKQVKCD